MHVMVNKKYKTSFCFGQFNVWVCGEVEMGSCCDNNMLSLIFFFFFFLAGWRHSKHWFYIDHAKAGPSAPFFPPSFSTSTESNKQHHAHSYTFLSSCKHLLDGHYRHCGHDELKRSNSIYATATTQMKHLLNGHQMKWDMSRCPSTRRQ